MTQMGSFIPARQATICPVDKIFTRVGASDDLATGQSTFMVEMNEVAQILRYATKDSLIILDEVGRGTSTFDGMSIARAVMEFIHEKIKAKTLFATHYHQLIALEDVMNGVKNYSVAVKERGNDIVFLRRIVPGGTDRSYGVHVARLAGLPKKVIDRAQDILEEYEQHIDIKVQNGQSEEEAIRDFGPVRELAAEILEKRIELTGIELEEYRTDFIGCNSLYRDAISKEIGSGTPCEVRLRAAGRTKDRKNAVLLANEVEALYTNGPAGGGGAVKRVSEIVSVCSIFVPRDAVEAKVTFREV